ncbi:MAG: YebC/PmpR family DNA-binding transcriptional regulator [Phycisphaerae bacterium]
MAGHSKWANIKHKKARNDAARGKQWSKCARAIMVAAKAGGGDPDANLNLRYAIDEAKAVNMPKDTIAKAIKKGTGELGGENYEQVIYEGYGPAGVAFIVDCLTDNRNRTAPEMRKIFERSGGSLGATNCVAWMFEQKGTFTISADTADEDTLMEIALEAGADDVEQDGEIFEITCEPAAFNDVREALEARELSPAVAQLALVPKNTVQVDADDARKVLNLLENLEDHDDVQKVYANFDLPDEVLAEMEA